jgi:cytochrome c553
VRVRVVLALAVAAAVSLLGASAEHAQADPKQMAYGKHLSQECSACHRLDGTGTGIPPIIGLEVDYFTSTMGFYKSGARENPAMVSVAQSLDDAQIKALAIYFGSLKPAPKSPAAPASKK